MGRTYPTKGPFAVYRMFAVDGALLYVGMSVNPTGRVAQHRLGKAWVREAVRMTLHWFDCREEAQRAEVAAIEAERPKYNLTANPHWVKLPYVISGGEVLAKWMEASGVPVAELSKRTGCAPAAIRKLATNKIYPRYRTAKAIADASGGAVPIAVWSRHRPATQEAA